MIDKFTISHHSFFIFKGFDLSDVKLPDTMYSVRSFYSDDSKTGSANQEMRNAGDQLNVQTERLANLNLSDDVEQTVDLVLQLSPNSLLLDYLTNLRNDLKDKLSILVYKHSSLSNANEQLIKKWLSLATNLTSCNLSNANQPSAYNLKIILKSGLTSNTSSLYKSNSNFKLNGEIKILSILNHLITSSLSIQVNDLNGLVYNLLLNEYLDYLQKSLNANQVDENRIKYYQTNLQIKSKVLELAEQIFRSEIKK